MYFCWIYPVGLDLERHRRPWLSLVLIGSLLAVFAWQQWAPGLVRWHPWSLVFYVGDGRPWTAVTALFLHAGWLHLLGNLVYLWTFLPALEDRLGRGGLLAIYLLTGVSGNLLHGLAAWQGWAGQDGLGILGASGAISGLLGYALVRLPHARVAVAFWVFAPLMGQNRAGRRHVPLPAAVAMWLVLQLVSAAVAPWTGSQVSYPAHLGGFVSGLLLALALGGLPEGRAEARLARARRYLARGEAWGAAGSFADYLAEVPDDLAAGIEHARALAMTGEAGLAAEAYRGVLIAARDASRWDLVLDAFAEGRRGRVPLTLGRDLLAAIAHHAEKAGRTPEAIAAYQELVRLRGDDPLVARAWIRLVLLLHGDPRRQAEAREWLDRARHALPAGAWRDYLDLAFSGPADARGAPAPAPSGGPPARGS